jgi:hypothetical protein
MLLATTPNGIRQHGLCPQPNTNPRVRSATQEAKLKSISVTTHIQSPPEVVWQILTGFGAYPDWNPFITHSKT